MKTKILHIIVLDKFIPTYINFIDQHFDISQHQFMALDKEKYEYGLTKNHAVKWLDKKSKIFELLIAMYQAEKVILHGLWIERIIQLLFLQPWLLKKCYWVMWGGDFYFPETQGWVKKQVIKKMGNLVTYIKGDYALAQKWYGAKGRYHECFMYPSNLYKDYDILPKAHDVINIQIGNSADPTNNHFEILEMLVQYKDQNIKIFAPLSYGDMEYTKTIATRGKEMFGDKFIPLLQFMPFEKYLELLGQIDIAVFAHNRQQAMGNTITLLGLGKKVYMRSDVTPWPLFKGLGVSIFDVEQLDVSSLGKDKARRNKEIIAGYFSERKLIEQYSEIFR